MCHLFQYDVLNTEAYTYISLTNCTWKLADGRLLLFFTNVNFFKNTIATDTAVLQITLIPCLKDFDDSYCIFSDVYIISYHV